MTEPDKTVPANQPADDRRELMRPEVELLPGRNSSRYGLLFALGAVLLTTLVAAPLYFFVSLPALKLLYVLAVVVTGLREGSRPALVVAILGLLAHSFVFNVPHFHFGLPSQDDLYSLVIFSLIALACGPVALRIRSQFFELHLSNRYLEALRLLGQDLSVAEDTAAVWRATARELRSALQTDCWLLYSENEVLHSEPPLETRDEKALQLVTWTLGHSLPTGRFVNERDDSVWTVFPVMHEGKAVAATLLHFNKNPDRLPDFDRELILAIMRQAAATWGRIQLSSDLEHARVHAEMEQLRSAMLSSVSHDLRSPLSAIMGAAESLCLLDRQLSAEDRRELASMIRMESHRLDSYIQNLLDMTRLENGALKIERDWVSVGDLVGSAISRLKRYFPSVRLEYHAVEEPPLLYVNPALIEQALFNIIENAVKYSPPEEAIVIRISGDDAFCRIEIEDKGPGIPEHLLEKVFDMFYVIGEGDHRKHGTGMGLAICRSMLAAHEGTVWAEPGHTGGTRFVVEVPLVYPDNRNDSFNEDL
jgi:two-component system sensor histidine kinase KdpD